MYLIKYKEGGNIIKIKHFDLCKNNRGIGYIDTIIGIFSLMLILALAMVVFPIFLQKQQLNTFANELVRQAEITGTTNQSVRIAELKAKTGLDPTITWDCDYLSGSRIQLNCDINVTLKQKADLGFFIFGSFPIELKAIGSGKSEVYFK